MARKQVGASAEKDKIGIVQLNTEPATPVTKTKNVLVGNVLLASLVVDAKPKFVKVDEVDEEDDTDDSKESENLRAMMTLYSNTEFVHVYKDQPKNNLKNFKNFIGLDQPQFKQRMRDHG